MIISSFVKLTLSLIKAYYHALLTHCNNSRHPPCPSSSLSSIDIILFTVYIAKTEVNYSSCNKDRFLQEGGIYVTVFAGHYVLAKSDVLLRGIKMISFSFHNLKMLGSVQKLYKSEFYDTR